MTEKLSRTIFFSSGGPCFSRFPLPQPHRPFVSPFSLTERWGGSGVFPQAIPSSFSGKLSRLYFPSRLAGKDVGYSFSVALLVICHFYFSSLQSDLHACLFFPTLLTFFHPHASEPPRESSLIAVLLFPPGYPPPRSEVPACGCVCLPFGFLSARYG